MRMPVVVIPLLPNYDCFGRIPIVKANPSVFKLYERAYLLDVQIWITQKKGGRIGTLDIDKTDLSRTHMKIFWITPASLSPMLYMKNSDKKITVICILKNTVERRTLLMARVALWSKRSWSTAIDLLFGNVWAINCKRGGHCSCCSKEDKRGLYGTTCVTTLSRMMRHDKRNDCHAQPSCQQEVV